MDKEFFEIANRLGACRLLHGTESMRIYIDTDVELTNPVKVFLAGSKAILHFDTIGRYNVILMHGAEAEIHASNYAVVFVKNAGGKVITHKDHTARVL